MVKKFSFNFKFLDRFRKSNTDAELEEIDSSEFEAMPMPMPMPMPAPTEFNMSVPEELNSSEFEDNEDADEFVEKTLSGYNLSQFKEDNASVIEIINTEIPNNDEDTETSGIHFQEMQPPAQPKVAKTPLFSFNSFKTSKLSGFGNNNRFNLKNSFQKIEKISWNELVLKIFSPYSRSKIHSAFLFFFIITLTYLLGKSVALITNRNTKIEIKSKSTISIPQDLQDSALTDIGKITSTNLFNAKESEEAKVAGPKVDISKIHCVEADIPTSKQIKLLDTIVLQDSVKSVASVQVRGASELLNIREGENLDGSEVSRITRMKLILKNLETGDCEYLASDKEEEAPLSTPIKILPASSARSIFKSMNPNIKNEGNNFKIKRKYRDEIVSKMSEVLTQAKAIQITNPDGTLCFKMTEIVPGSVYSSLNIQESDIICNLNGKKIENLNDLMGILGRIKEIDSMQIGLKRNGMQENLDYNFE